MQKNIIEALDRLIKWGWVRAVGYKGEIFELTSTGYSKADWLKEGMGIDTSKNPLDELKKFEDWYLYIHKVPSKSQFIKEKMDYINKSDIEALILVFTMNYMRYELKFKIFYDL